MTKDLAALAEGVDVTAVNTEDFIREIRKNLEAAL